MPIDSPKYVTDSVTVLMSNSSLTALMDTLYVLWLKVRPDFIWFVNCSASVAFFPRILLTLEAAVRDAQKNSSVSSTYYKMGIRSPPGAMVGKRAGRLISKLVNIFVKASPHIMYR